MMSIGSNMHRMLNSGEDARRLLYLSSLHQSSQNLISAPKDDILAVRRNPLDISQQSHLPQQQNSQRIQSCPTPNTSTNKRNAFGATQPNTAVSRRNARERKRVRLVNLGFSTLRERVPPGAKNKKLSKVETLRAAIDYIGQLQRMLGMAEPQSFEDKNFQSMLSDENYGQDDCSSVASSEEIGVVGGSCGPSGGSGDLSPASSHPSDYSLVSSPYTNQATQDDHLMDIGLWFS
ncbi:achaete-scute homolog 1-like [Argiope bruennichi]|uniref:Achaete-scute like protein n=1 Tax=Argiope bruennichi TaxID=94029 RepID=A0A8T0ECE4_ARGBR|nr:achaete-scute homolog 1-like [Argiope bruennichi]KAF8770491.1 Achaete-scute like protein [Argiope bruennichi]